MGVVRAVSDWGVDRDLLELEALTEIPGTCLRIIHVVFDVSVSGIHALRVEISTPRIPYADKLRVDVDPLGSIGEQDSRWFGVYHYGD